MPSTAMSAPRGNPFRIHGTVRSPFFTDRDQELGTFIRVLQEPTAKMLVYGQRRMGKTSTLENAVHSVNADGGHAFLADISTVTTVADMANRILAGATKAVGRRWTTLATDLLARLSAGFKLTTDPATGLATPSLEVSVREASAEHQRASLAAVLDSLDELAGARGVTLGIVLDEFQEISKLGGEQAEWHLRGVMQQHQHLSYIVAGSKPSLLKAMVDKGRAFYDMLDPYAFGPIDRRHMTAWIDERMHSVGLVPVGAGEFCVTYAGARSRDIVRLARKCVDRAVPGDTIGVSEVAAAYREIVEEDDDTVRSWWNDLKKPQQNLVRAIAAEDHGLTTQAARKQFGLSSSSNVSHALRALIEDGRVIRTRHGSGYAFDNPFVRGWVVVHALPDLGMRFEPTCIASPSDEYEKAPSVQSRKPRFPRPQREASSD
jgi:hypothetical protein